LALLGIWSRRKKSETLLHEVLGEKEGGVGVNLQSKSTYGEDRARENRPTGSDWTRKGGRPAGSQDERTGGSTMGGGRGCIEDLKTNGFAQNRAMDV